MDDPGSAMGDFWPRSGRAILNAERGEKVRARGVRPGRTSKGGRTNPNRERDLVVRGEETLPPRLALAAASHLGEQTQAVVLPLLDRVEIAGVVFDQRLDQRSAVADVPGLVPDARPMVDRGQDVTARLGAVRQHREGAGTGGALGDEVALHEDLERILELEQVPEEAARRARRFPRGEPVALGDAGPLEHLAVHLEVPLLVG